MNRNWSEERREKRGGQELQKNGRRVAASGIALLLGHSQTHELSCDCPRCGGPQQLHWCLATYSLLRSLLQLHWCLAGADLRRSRASASSPLLLPRPLRCPPTPLARPTRRLGLPAGASRAAVRSAGPSRPGSGAASCRRRCGQQGRVLGSVDLFIKLDLKRACSRIF